ncbi:hypothetical protein ACI3KS_04275 [Microbacterium sp. ZW T5_45]|uniref:hypothetical protein n=1 Tax=Microbacterium sp. ZW T5_45 TaxID=3378080 RepID=UPI003854BE7E
MSRFTAWVSRQMSSVVIAARALRSWGPRQIITAVVAALATALVIGVATVLIPNSFFARDIPPVWWNYPVWILTSAMTGILTATYIRPRDADGSVADEPTDGSAILANGEGASDRRGGRFAVAGGLLAWFAVGCPVCNKIALLALGYTGALTWFAPLQPVLAITAMVFSTVAVVWRLKGQVACPLPAARETVPV